MNDKTVLEQLISFTEFNSYYFANKRWNYTTEHWSEIRPKFMGPNLKEKFIYSNNYDSKDDVIIKVDYYSLIKNLSNSETQSFIQNLNLILQNLQSNDSYQGTYNMSCFNLEVNNLIDTNKFHLNNTQYLFDTQEFIFN